MNAFSLTQKRCFRRAFAYLKNFVPDLVTLASLTSLGLRVEGHIFWAGLANSIFQDRKGFWTLTSIRTIIINQIIGAAKASFDCSIPVLGSGAFFAFNSYSMWSFRRAFSTFILGYIKYLILRTIFTSECLLIPVLGEDTRLAFLSGIQIWLIGWAFTSIALFIKNFSSTTNQINTDPFFFAIHLMDRAAHTSIGGNLIYRGGIFTVLTFCGVQENIWFIKWTFFCVMGSQIFEES